MRTDVIWSVAQMVELVTALAAADIDCTIHTYGTHTGDSDSKPWDGPIAWEITATRRGLGSSEDWAWPLDDIVEMNATLNQLGVEAVLSSYSQDRGLCLRLTAARQNRFMVERPPDPTDRKAV